MVFNTPTELNIVDSDRFMFERNKLLHFNYNLRLRPHIFSHIAIEIRFNHSIQTPNKMPPENNIYVGLKSTKKYCQQISGQMSYPRGKMCNEESTPLVFKSGNSDIEACHSACFNLFDKKKDKSGTAYRAPFAKFNKNQNCCSIYNNDMFALGIDDYNRADSHLTPRLDTIGTGFDVNDDDLYTDLEGNETFKFKMNKYYCDEFMKKWDGKECYTPFYEDVFGFFISSTLYKACQYGYRWYQTGITINEVNKPDVPPIKTPVPKSKEGWLQDVNSEAFFINPYVTLTDLGITNPGLKHLIFTTEHGWPGRLVEPLIVYQELGSLQPDVDIVDFDAINKHRIRHFKMDSYGWRDVDEYEFLNIYTNINQSALANRKDGKEHNTVDDRTDWQKRFEEFFATLSGGISPYTPLFVFGSWITGKIIQNLTEVMESTAISIETGVVTCFLANLSMRIMKHSLFPILLKPAFKVMILTLRVLASAIKVIDVISSAGGLIDLLDLPFDFFNFKNEIGVSTIEQYSQLDIQSRIKAYGYGTVDYSPVMLISMFEHITTDENGGTNHDIRDKTKRGKTPLPPFSEYCSLLKDYKKNDAKWKFKLEDVVDRYDYPTCMFWSTQYLYSLDVNSNGLPINWSEDKMLCEVKDLHEFFDTTYKNYLSTFDNYSEFTQNFKKKINLLTYVVPVAFIFVVALTFMKMVYAVIFLFFASSAIYAIVFTDALTPEPENNDSY